MAHQPPLRDLVRGADQHDRRQELRLRGLALPEVNLPRVDPRSATLRGFVASRQRSLSFVMPSTAVLGYHRPPSTDPPALLGVARNADDTPRLRTRPRQPDLWAAGHRDPRLPGFGPRRE